ncbi:hypothetical protein [Deinococcus sp. PEB2-67]
MEENKQTSKHGLSPSGLRSSLPPIPGRIIGLSGHDGSGKTTTARVIAELTGGVIISLADPLKAQAAQHLGLTEAEVRLKPTPPHLRNYLRALGWAMRVESGADYWLRLWHAHALRLLHRGVPVVIVDDVRHINEYDWIAHLTSGYVAALYRADTEPDIADNLPPIITEVWDVRQQAAADRVKLEQRTAVVSVNDSRPEQVARRVLFELGLSDLIPDGRA